MKLTAFEKALKRALALADGLPKGAYKNGIKNLLAKATYKLDYIKRDEEHKELRGKEHFEAKDGVKPTTEVKTETPAGSLEGLKKIV